MAKRFIILQVVNTHYHQDLALRNMQEIEQLVATYGGVVIEKTVQHKAHPDPNTYIGKGKVEWLLQTAKEKEIDVIVLNAVVNSGQLFRLEKELWKVNPYIAVWDRIDLILNIFDKHATSTEAKLQIDLAKIQHKGPRIYGLGKTELSRQGAGIGTRGKGETNIEIEKRNIKKLKQRIQQQIKKLAKVQESRIQNRKQNGIGTSALIGYTSAGKTSLFNVLTRKGKQTNKALFTTLDSVVGKLKPQGNEKTKLISDTIGFIDDLPPFLITAFRSTLLESIEAQILLHVVDSADPAVDEKIDVVEKILLELEVSEKPLLIFNKTDLITPERKKRLEEKYEDRKTFFVSAKTEAGLEELRSLVQTTFL